MTKQIVQPTKRQEQLLNQEHFFARLGQERYELALARCREKTLRLEMELEKLRVELEFVTCHAEALECVEGKSPWISYMQARAAGNQVALVALAAFAGMRARRARRAHRLAVRFKDWLL